MLSLVRTMKSRPTKARVYILGKVLEATRLARGLNQSQLAALYNARAATHGDGLPNARRSLDVSAISHYENAAPGSDRARAYRDTALVLAEVLDLTVNELGVPVKIQDEERMSDQSANVPDQSEPAPDENKNRESDKLNNTAKLIGVQHELESINLPYISVPARAGFASMAGELSSFPLNDFRRVYLRGNPPSMYTGRVVFEVDGDSMEPYINGGDEVVACQVPEGRWEDVLNCIAVVAYGDVVTIKKIIGNDLFTKGTLALRPYRDELAPVVVRRVDIRSIFRVEEVLPRPFKARL
jgi:transcriptional regulator with XRE-family HTH domain